MLLALFDGPFFDSIISLITLYLLFSQLALSLVELPAGFLNRRGRYLHHQLQAVLGPVFTTAFYASAAIRSLMSPASKRSWLAQLLSIPGWPAYVSEALFAQTLLATLSGLAPPASPPLPALGQLQAGLAVLAAQAAPPTIVGIVSSYAEQAATAPNPAQALQTSLEAWFHEYGERMTGWYKRDSRWPLFWAGLLVAALADVDTPRLARFLFDSGNAKARLALVSQASTLVQAPRPPGPLYNPTSSAQLPPGSQPGAVIDEASQAFRTTLGQVPAVGLPLGWLRWANTATTPTDTTRRLDPASHQRVYVHPTPCQWAVTADDYQLPAYAQRWTLNAATGQVEHPAGWSWWSVLGGWLLTAFALMLGAPFWFDTLCRFVNIRNVGIKPATAPKAG